MRSFVLIMLACLAVALPARAQSRDEAQPRDLQRLQEDLANLDEDLRGLEDGDRQTDEFRQRAEEIREQVIYLKVKMQRHERAGRAGTGVMDDEVGDVQRSIRDLRDDMERSFGGSRGREREVRLREGTEILVRLEEGLSSRTARVEDRFEASVFRPVRADRGIAIPAGVTLRGTVRYVQAARRPSKEGRLDLDFNALMLERERVDMTGHVVALGSEGDGRAGSKVGVGATLGGILGAILGGGKGLVIGGVLGAGGAVVGTKGDDVDLPAGTILTVVLDRPLVVPRTR
jgi:hypothetical protein